MCIRDSYNLNGRTTKGYFPGCDDTTLANGMLAPNAICTANKAATPKQRTPFYGTSALYPYPSAAPFGGNYGWTGGDRNQAADLNSKYNALQIQAEKRFSNGLSFQSSYTFQHAISDNTGSIGWGRYDNIDKSVTYGPNQDYRNHAFILTQVYELPFGKGKKWASNVGTAANLIVGGWSINSATNFSSGLPWTPGLSSCSKSIDAGPCIADVKGSVKAGPRSGRPDTPGYWYQIANCGALNPSSGLGVTCGPWGQTATLDGFGNAGVNRFHGPKFFNTSASLFKAFNFGERFRAQTEFKFYNLFNHVNLNQPDRCVDCGTGGQINALAAGAQMRRLEYGVKLIF